MFKVFRSLAVIVCLFIFSSTALAASDMDAFREAMTKTSAKPDTRIFREQVIFFTPYLKANLDFQAVSNNSDSIRMQGNLDYVMTNDKGNTEVSNIPFYLDQKNNDMILYYKTDKNWLKKKAPIASAAAVDLIAAPSKEDLEKEIAMVKDVKVVMESQNQRTMFVVLDSNKIADSIMEYSKKEADPNLTAQEREIQNMVIKYIDQGIRNAEISYTWTIDKQDWQTITLAMDLSDILKSIVNACVSDPENVYAPIIKDLAEPFVYYSELKAYTTFLDPNTKQTIDIPKNVLKAKEVKDTDDDKKAKK